ncbi:MAG TPA: ImmA/IrrE family metallo-endopeptidase [Candidatus Babeliaceae bacterium]|nr:ImmA/IrrE family metallo-endopeptidase [Candidatus Babeliaceae bacterium]
MRIAFLSNCSLILSASLLALYASSQAVDYAYQDWLTAEVVRWENQNVSDIVKKVELLGKIEELSQESAPEKILERHFAYCLLREHYHLPESQDDPIDFQWLSNIKQELDSFLAIEELNSMGWPIELPEQEHQFLLENITETLGLNITVVPFTTSTLGFAYITPLLDRNLIAISNCNDEGMRFFSLYHELSHILNNDIKTKQSLWNNEISAESLAISKDIIDIETKTEYYLQLGIKALELSTPGLALRLKEIVRNHNSYWQPPLEQERYHKTLYLRATEKRADLFAIESLLKEHKYFALKSAITKFANTEQIIEYYDTHNHVSGIERTLYILGYISDQDLDINNFLGNVL